jgi:hypothetical protein
MGNPNKLKRPLLWLLARAMVLIACAAMISPVTSPAWAAESPRPTSRHIQWLGTSSWILSSSDDVVVVDPFFTRPSFVRVTASLMLPFLPSNFAYDSERIRAVLPELPKDTKFVLLTHALRPFARRSVLHQPELREKYHVCRQFHCAKHSVGV